MFSYPRGQVAFACGMMFIFGHFAAFVLVWANSSISPTAKNDITSIIVPITVASVTSAVLYAVKHAEIDLKNTPTVNPFFFLVSIIIPAMFFAVLLYGIFDLDGERSVDQFKLYIVAAEAMFGGVFVIVTEALFGSHKADGTASQEPDSSTGT